jgi:hypothetical protein
MMTARQGQMPKIRLETGPFSVSLGQENFFS